MNNTKLISEYYKDDGSVAKVYRIITQMDGDHSFYSITFKDKDGKRKVTEDFPFKSLRYVEDAAENFTLGIKEVNYA
jgi:hypothetical protein